MGVAKKSISAWLDRGVVNKISFSMAGKGRGQKVNVSTQHVWKGLWSKKNVSSWLKRGVVEK
jgi:hypothetical protein